MPYTVLDRTLAAAAPTVVFGAPVTTGDTYTLNEFYQELILRLGDRTDVTLTRATKWINDAYRDISASLDLLQLKGGFNFSTVPNQSMYLLPKNVRSISKISVSDAVVYQGEGGSKLLPLDEASYRLLSDVKGEPTHYYMQGEMVVLYPTPTDVRTIIVDAKFRPQPLTVALASTQKPIIPAEWNEGLLRLATQYAFSALLEFDLAANAENLFVSWVRRQKDPDTSNQEDKIPRFRVLRKERDFRRMTLRSESSDESW